MFTHRFACLHTHAHVRRCWVCMRINTYSRTFTHQIDGRPVLDNTIRAALLGDDLDGSGARIKVLHARVNHT